jgi:transposase
LDILKEKAQGVGINAIAKEAGVSKSLIYRYLVKGLLLLLPKKGDFFKLLSVIDEKKII